jgi:hypothetical protein
MSDNQQPTASPDGSARETPPQRRRSWWRLHFSTWVVIAVPLAILTLIVVPGSPNNHDLFVSAPLFYEHGWPFVFLDRYFPPPPGRAGPDASFKFLRDWRDKQGLRRAMSDNEDWLWSEDDFLHGEPSWLDGSRWPLRGESLVSVAGLALDIAVVLVIAAAVAALYECWARRRWQYRLRSLLGAFLIIAMGLGWWRHSINEYQRDSQATTVLRKKGLDVAWRYSGPVWLMKLVGQNHLRPLHYVVSVTRHLNEDANGMAGDEADVSSVVDSDLGRVHEWSRLQQLYLSNTRITDAGLKYVEGRRELDTLDLEGTQVTDAGLAHLHDLPKLRFLILNSTRITGKGLRHLKGLAHLQDLSLDKTQITDDDLPTLKDLPELHDLSLCNTKVTDAGVPHLAALTNLKIVRLDGTGVTNAGLRHFEGAVQLEKLELNQTQVTRKGIARLQRALPKCEIEWEWKKGP